MVCKIVQTSEFDRDLDHIVYYLIDVLGNRQAAKALLDEIDDCIDRLQKMPYMFPECDDISLKAYRKITVRGYVVIYRVDEANNTAYILRIFHGKQDYLKLL